MSDERRHVVNQAVEHQLFCCKATVQLRDVLKQPDVLNSLSAQTRERVLRTAAKSKYNCSLCDTNLTSKTHANAHALTVHNALCPVCYKGYKTDCAYRLLRHMKKHGQIVRRKLNAPAHRLESDDEDPYASLSFQSDKDSTFSEDTQRIISPSGDIRPDSSSISANVIDIMLPAGPYSPISDAAGSYSPISDTKRPYSPISDVDDNAVHLSIENGKFQGGEVISDRKSHSIPEHGDEGFGEDGAASMCTLTLPSDWISDEESDIGLVTSKEQDRPLTVRQDEVVDLISSDSQQSDSQSTTSLPQHTMVATLGNASISNNVTKSRDYVALRHALIGGPSDSNAQRAPPSIPCRYCALVIYAESSADIFRAYGQHLRESCSKHPRYGYPAKNNNLPEPSIGTHEATSEEDSAIDQANVSVASCVSSLPSYQDNAHREQLNTHIPLAPRPTAQTVNTQAVRPFQPSTYGNNQAEKLAINSGLMPSEYNFLNLYGASSHVHTSDFYPLNAATYISSCQSMSSYPIQTSKPDSGGTTQRARISTPSPVSHVVADPSNNNVIYETLDGKFASIVNQTSSRTVTCKICGYLLVKNKIAVRTHFLAVHKSVIVDKLKERARNRLPQMHSSPVKSPSQQPPYTSNSPTKKLSDLTPFYGQTRRTKHYPYVRQTQHLSNNQHTGHSQNMGHNQSIHQSQQMGNTQHISQNQHTGTGSAQYMGQNQLIGPIQYAVQSHSSGQSQHPGEPSFTGQTQTRISQQHASTFHGRPLPQAQAMELKCPFEHCTYITASTDDLASHISQNHQSGLKFCDQCDYSTLYEENLKSHQKSHHSVYNCSFCPYSTCNQTALHLHAYTEHG